MAETTDAQSTGQPPKRASKLGLIVAVLVVVGGAGGGAAWMFLRPAQAAAETKKPDAAEGGGIVSFEPFVANLADPGGARYLRISVRLIVPRPEDAEHIQKSEIQLMRIRSGILELLGEQKAGEVVTPAGKAALKQAIAARAAAVIEPVKVSDVLFSDFVVQF